MNDGRGALPPQVEAAHAAAMAAGEDGYVDPISGLWVFTAGYLARRGYCCDRGCRHCPYDAALSDDAARPRDGR